MSDVMLDVAKEIDRLKAERDFYRDELEQVKLVLAWASENVDTAYGPFETRSLWRVYPRGACLIDQSINSPTLYEALKSAWEHRGER